MKILLNVVLVLSVTFCFAQKDEQNYIKERNKSLQYYFNELASSENDTSRENINKNITSIFDELLKKEKTFKYNFDSLKFMGVITSDDSKLRLYNWNIALSDGTHKYFCYVQYFNKKGQCEVVKLEDKSADIETPENMVLINTLWYGALYYDIIVKKAGRKKYYTLLGWDGNNIYTTKKIIDVLYFKNGKTYFGDNIFKKGREKQHRIILEYANMTSVMLKYNKKHDMIVFDHLSPSDKVYEGQYQYYGPDYSFDALEFKKGKWHYISKVDPEKVIDDKVSTTVNTLKKKKVSYKY